MTKLTTIGCTILLAATTWGCTGQLQSGDEIPRRNDAGTEPDGGTFQDAAAAPDATTENDASTDDAGSPDGGTVTPPTGKLKYAPPSDWESYEKVYIPIDSRAVKRQNGQLMHRDENYLLVFPSTPVRQGIEIDMLGSGPATGNLVAIGGHIEIIDRSLPRGANYGIQCGPCGNLFLEGVRIDGQALNEGIKFGDSGSTQGTVTLQNVYIGEVFGGDDTNHYYSGRESSNEDPWVNVALSHSDSIQVDDNTTIAALNMYNVTMDETHGQSVIAKEGSIRNQSTWENVDFLVHQGPMENKTMYGGGERSIYLPRVPTDRIRCVDDTVYVDHNRHYPESKAPDSSPIEFVSPYPDSDWLDGNLMTFPAGTHPLRGRIRAGVRPGGFAVDKTTIGIGYVSPGYQ